MCWGGYANFAIEIPLVAPFPMCAYYDYCFRCISASGSNTQRRRWTDHHEWTTGPCFPLESVGCESGGELSSSLVHGCTFKVLFSSVNRKEKSNDYEIVANQEIQRHCVELWI